MCQGWSLMFGLRFCHKQTKGRVSQLIELCYYHYDLIFLDSSSKYVRSIDGGWGSKQEDGTINGMIGMLNRSEVDCAVSDFGLTRDRASAADFINPIAAARFIYYLICAC